jgi:MFS family permease
MIVLDVTIVNVALPSIRADLHFDDASLAWVVNAYMLTFGGFSSLAGVSGISMDSGACSCWDSDCSRWPRSLAG